MFVFLCYRYFLHVGSMLRRVLQNLPNILNKKCPVKKERHIFRIFLLEDTSIGIRCPLCKQASSLAIRVDSMLHPARRNPITGNQPCGGQGHPWLV